jgi:hypothetical protein
MKDTPSRKATGPLDRTGAGSPDRAGGSDVARPTEKAAIDQFLSQARSVQSRSNAPRGRLAFALDATMSRQPTWDIACGVQSEMFKATSAIGGLDVQLVYFRGFAECRASRWVGDATSLTSLMNRIACQGGHTQIRRVLEHVRDESRAARIGALIYVGDAMEEPLDTLCAIAGEISLLGVKAFMFQEGRDPVAEKAYREIARLTGGAYARFDVTAPGQLAELLRSAAAYAAGGRAALEALADRHGGEARRLIGQMR